MRISSALVLVVVALLGAGEAGSAPVQRTFVSKFGVDTNPCSATEPCRTFGAAIEQTLDGGEVIALDSAGYGPVKIEKSISLIAPAGIHAGITTTVPGADAILVNAPPGATVVLKGLALSGIGIGNRGIVFTGGSRLRVDGVTVSGFVGEGIRLGFTPDFGPTVTVTDSVVRDNGAYGIAFEGFFNAIGRLTVERTRLLGNGGGLFAGEFTRVWVRDTVASGASGVGFEVFFNGVLALENCFATHNNVGINSDGGLSYVAGTTVGGNNFGLGAGAGGSILSRGNNSVEHNFNGNGIFTGAFAAK